MAVRGQIDVLPLKLLRQGGIFIFCIQNQDMVVGSKERIGHFPLGKKRLSAARCAQHNPIGAFQGFAVSQNMVVGAL